MSRGSLSERFSVRVTAEPLGDRRARRAWSRPWRRGGPSARPARRTRDARARRVGVGRGHRDAADRRPRRGRPRRSPTGSPSDAAGHGHAGDGGGDAGQHHGGAQHPGGDGARRLVLAGGAVSGDVLVGLARGLTGTSRAQGGSRRVEVRTTVAARRGVQGANRAATGGRPDHETDHEPPCRSAGGPCKPNAETRATLRHRLPHQSRRPQQPPDLGRAPPGDRSHATRPLRPRRDTRTQSPDRRRRSASHGGARVRRADRVRG